MESQVQSAQQTPQQVYIANPPVPSKSGSGILKFIIGLGCISLTICFICSVPFFFLANITPSVDSSQSKGIIKENTILTLESDSSSKARLAVINVTGAISYSVPGADGQELIGATTNNLISQIRKAKEDDSVGAVLFRFNTPGGEVNAAEPICKEMKDLGAKKPTYSFIDTMGASLGYLLPNCTKYIYSRPSAMTGSIGVVLSAVDFYGILENFGGKVVFITNSEGKQKTGQEIFTPNSETYKIYQKMLDETYEYFINKVYEGRVINNPGVSKAELKKFADGRVFSGLQAKEIKLVDEIGEFDVVIKSLSEKEEVLKNKKLEVFEYQQPTNPFADLFGSLETSVKNTNPENILHKQGSTKLLMQHGIVN